MHLGIYPESSWKDQYLCGQIVLEKKLEQLSLYTVSQKNCANLFFVRTLSNFDRL